MIKNKDNGVGYAPNTEGYKIRTPNGYESFDGVRKVIHDSYLSITLNGNIKLECSLDHRLKVSNGETEYWEFARNLNPKLHLLKNGITNKYIQIIHIDYIEEEIELYDIVNSGKDYSYLANGIISHNCEFMGSSNTLIAGTYIKNMVTKEPEFTHDKLNLFELPKKDHKYVISVDVSRGKGLDKSAFSIIDVTDYPFKQVGSFYDNEISPLLFPTLISKVGYDYNEAYLLVENNDVGAQVVSILSYELEYENILSPQPKNSNSFEEGLKTTKYTKMVGCSTFRDLIESQKLIIQCSDSVHEISGFIVKGNSGNSKKYEADNGYNDDLVMTLVNFSYLTTTEEFKELQDDDLRKILFDKRMKHIEEDVLPMPLIDDGLGNDDYYDDMSINEW